MFVKGAAIGQDLLIGLNSFYLRNSPAGLECIGSPVGLANVASLRQASVGRGIEGGGQVHGGCRVAGSR